MGETGERWRTAVWRQRAPRREELDKGALALERLVDAVTVEIHHGRGCSARQEDQEAG